MRRALKTYLVIAMDSQDTLLVAFSFFLAAPRFSLSFFLSRYFDCIIVDIFNIIIYIYCILFAIYMSHKFLNEISYFNY